MKRNNETYIKDAFAVIGKEGSTEDGAGFVQRLWSDANARFAEVAHLAKKDENGDLVGIWGAMTDFSRTFQPWQDGFSKGLYLAGVECGEDAVVPDGWAKWEIPGYVYLRVGADGPTVFGDMLAYLRSNNLSLAGAVHDTSDPISGKNYMMFPIEKL